MKKIIVYVKKTYYYVNEIGFCKTICKCMSFIASYISIHFFKHYYLYIMRRQKNLQRQKINIGFIIGGGFGDFLIFANYLRYFKNRFSDSKINIDVYFYYGFSNASVLFREGELCRKCYQHTPPDDYQQAYDLFIEVSRYPKILACDYAKIQKKYADMIEYIDLIKRFRDENPRFFNGASCDGQSATFSEFKNQKRIQQPDIYGYLGITEEYAYPLFIDGDEQKFLQTYGLTDKKYITMHRGCDAQYPHHVKMWPVQNYGKLAKLIKTEFPEIIIVQYGVSVERCPPMENIDLNLVGRTSMDQVKIILKNSLLHIDSDGGMVHLRHALRKINGGGVCLAMYGPNYENFFGYSENINITGDGCSHFCDWLTEDWMVNCARGFENPPCMTSITPEQIMSHFRRFMKTEGM